MQEEGTNTESSILFFFSPQESWLVLALATILSLETLRTILKFSNITRSRHMDSGILRNGGFILSLFEQETPCHLVDQFFGSGDVFFFFSFFLYFIWRRTQTIPPVHTYCLYTTYLFIVIVRWLQVYELSK